MYTMFLIVYSPESCCYLMGHTREGGGLFHRIKTKRDGFINHIIVWYTPFFLIQLIDRKKEERWHKWERMNVGTCRGEVGVCECECAFAVVCFLCTRSMHSLFLSPSALFKFFPLLHQIFTSSRSYIICIAWVRRKFSTM